ncbi:sensor histidine kinase [Mongoliitalea daihaiensis]|uniref:sensor histidine kinase n=1 Tax=Mongoliitalea daihaiensis TaxID=2782006 RepID=UPI001F30910F|nr:HAMP domain-containing sensor histidine kinase [Mongoliitalea daihaiensis]UJP65491.1 HAMP domain-containing histidine kinase [Mongoliitalea daihaiensis]
MHFTTKINPQIPQDLQDRFQKKAWDAANYVYWGTLSILLGLFILEFFLLKSIWTTTLYIKVILVAFSFISYFSIRKVSKTPNALVLIFLMLFTVYCFTIIHQVSNFSVTFYFCLLALVLSVANYLMLWNSTFSLMEISFTVLVFLLFQYLDGFEHFGEYMQLGGYTFFSFILITSFIPDARKRNYLLNLERELKKQTVVDKLSIEVNSLQLQMEELQQSQKIDNEKEKILRHDLKNKINNIIGLSQLIDGSEMQEEDQMYIQLLKDVSTDLLKYADNLYNNNENKLDLPLKIMLEPVNVFALLKKTKNEIQAKLETKGVDLVLPEKEINTYILADFLVMNNVLENIFNYLIRWSDPGQRIEIEIMKPLDHIRIEVHAPSTSITVEELNNLFKPIENFEFKSSFDAPKGLGLQIAKSMTEKIGGYFKYQKDLKGGVTFKLEFKSTQIQEL